MKKIILIVFSFFVIVYFVYGNELDKKYSFTTEDISFINGKVVLKGSLVIPITTIPCPGIIMIHGSGKANRDLVYAQKLAEKGIAVLTYDKRGCGESQGKYEWNLNVSNKNLNLLANDAKSGLSLFINNPRIDQKKIGIWGISQAGWIAPLVVSKTNIISFCVMLSGPTVTVKQELKFSMLVEKDPNYLENSSQKQITKDINKWNPSDIYFFIVGFKMDPIKYLRKIDIPILWLYGDKDNSIPAFQSQELLKKLNKANNTVIVYQNYGHLLQEPGSSLIPSDKVNNDFIQWIFLLK